MRWKQQNILTSLTRAMFPLPYPVRCAMPCINFFLFQLQKFEKISRCRRREQSSCGEKCRVDMNNNYYSRNSNNKNSSSSNNNNSNKNNNNDSNNLIWVEVIFPFVWAHCSQNLLILYSKGIFNARCKNFKRSKFRNKLRKSEILDISESLFLENICQAHGAELKSYGQEWE